MKDAKQKQIKIDKINLSIIDLKELNPQEGLRYKYSAKALLEFGFHVQKLLMGSNLPSDLSRNRNKYFQKISNTD